MHVNPDLFYATCLFGSKVETNFLSSNVLDWVLAFECSIADREADPIKHGFENEYMDLEKIKCKEVGKQLLGLDDVDLRHANQKCFKARAFSHCE